MSVSQTSELPSSEIVAVTRQQLWQAGYHCLAVLTQDKRPLGNDWGERARRSPPEVLAFPPVAHALNTGVLSDDLRPLDLDIDIPAIAEAVLELILDTLGDAPVRRRGNSPRCLAVYRAAEGPQRKIVLAGRHGKIEVLGRGQQFVAAGVHPSGAELTWQPELRYTPAADLPAVTEDQIFDLLTALAPLIDAPPPVRANGHDHTPHEGEPSEPQADILRVTAALAAIPNSGPADWEAWNRVGMATWAATGGSSAGFQAWDAWSARNPAYDPEKTHKRWEHYPTSPPTRIGAGSLFHMAGDAFRPPAPLPFGLDQARPDLNPAGQEPSDTFPVEMFRDIAVNPAVGDFVEGLLVAGTMAVIYGESGSGKTFFATDLCLHVAWPKPWNDREVDQGGVIYCALEGAHGIRNRVAAFRTHHGLQDADLPFAVIPVSMNLLDPAVDVQKLIRTVLAQAAKMTVPLRVVAIDTLSRAMAGGNENAPDDMGALVTNGTAIQQATGATVIWVHHCGKDQARGARGHSLLRAATDTEIEVSADGAQRLARVTKQREMECVGEFFFTLKIVELGHNHRGKPITSCVVEYAQPMHGQEAATASRKLSGHTKRAYEVLVNLCAEIGKTGFGGTPSGVPSVPEDWWRDRFMDRAMPGEKDDTKGKAFRRASEKLITEHLVGMAQKRVWIVSPYDAKSNPVQGNDTDEMC